MTVGQLQSYLRGLADAIGAHNRSPAKDLIDAAGRLDPFASLDMAAFGAFLLLAEEYRTTGKILDTGNRTTKKGGQKAPSAPKTTAAEVVALIHLRQSQVLTDPGMTREKIQAELQSMKGSLKKEAWLGVTKEMGYSKKPASIDAAINVLVEHIMARKGAFERSDA